MRRTYAAMGVAIMVVAAACQSAEPTTDSSTDATPVTPTSPTTSPTTSATASPTTSPTTPHVTVATSTTTSTTTRPAPSTSTPPGDACIEVAADGAPGPATYSEAAFDRFDPLDPAPSLTIQSGDVRVSDPIVMRAARIDGGVLVSASRSPNLPSTPDDRLPVVAVDHDGTIRWSRCLDGNRELQTVVAAPAHRPSLSISGDVLVSELTSDVVSGAVESIGTGAVVARWHDGTWSSETLEPPGWVLLDDRTGREVPGQRWDDPELFTLYPSREVSGFNRTARAGGLVIVVKGDQVEVWYPKGTGGGPRSVVLP